MGLVRRAGRKLGRELKSRFDALLEGRGQMRAQMAPAEEVRRTLSLLRPREVGLDLVRLGGDHDGGYLVPDDLTGITACFSPGVSDVADFERDLARRYGVPCFLADASVEAPPVADPLFDFERKFLGARTGPDTMRLADWVAAKARPGDRELMLQMDIEGAEFEVLFDTPAEVLDRFRIVVIELHWLQDVFLPGGQRAIELLLRRLTQHHTPVHVHPNNCCGSETRGGITVPKILEVTLLRNDRFEAARPATVFTHRLDRPNLAAKPDLPLPAALFDAA